MKMFKFPMIYMRRLPEVLAADGREKLVLWYTLRDLGMGIPGGMELVGEYSPAGIRPATSFDRRQWWPGRGNFGWGYQPEERKGVWNLLRRAIARGYRQACRLADKYEKDSGMSMNPLDRLPSIVIDGENIVIVIAFRESEAAQAVFEEGCRTTRYLHHDPYPPMWRWNILGKIQEEAEKAAA